MDRSGGFGFDLECAAGLLDELGAVAASELGFGSVSRAACDRTSFADLGTLSADERADCSRHPHAVPTVKQIKTVVIGNVVIGQRQLIANRRSLFLLGIR